MPSGPKKRRASRRKKGGNASSTDPTEEDMVTAVGLHESNNNGSEMSFSSNEFQSVDIQTGVKENVKENEDVDPVLDKSESVHRVVLNEPNSENPEENECGEVGESACLDQEPSKEPIGLPSSELQAVVKTVDQSDLKVTIPSKEAQDSSLVNHMNPVEGVVQSNGYHGPPPAIVDHVVKESEAMSIEGVLQDPLEDPSESSSHEPQAMVQTVDDEIPIKEGDQGPSSGSVIEVDVDTISFEDAEESFGTPLGSPSMGYMSPFKGDVHLINDNWNKQIERSLHEPLNEAQDASLPAESVDHKVNGHTFLKDSQDSFKESLASSSLVDVSHVQENGCAEVGENACHDESMESGQISIEGVLEEPFEEEPIEPSSDELQAMVKVVDNSVLEVIPSKDAEDPFVSVESLSETNVETSLKNVQDSLTDPLRDSYMDHLSPHVEGLVQGNKCDERTCHDQPAMVNHVESVMKEDDKMCIEDVLEEPITRSSDQPQSMVKTVDQDPSVQVESVTEMNVDTSFKDAQDSSKESLESPSFGEVAFVSENVHLNGYGIEPIECSSHEQEATVKTADQVVLQEEAQDPSVPVESLSEATIEASLKDVQDSFKEPLGDSSMDHGQPSMVNLVDSFIKEDEEMSIEGVVEENSEEPIVHSSDEQHIMVKKVDDQSVLKGIPLEEVQDPFVPVESIIEANVETSFKDAQDSSKETLGSPSMVNVSPVEKQKNNEIGESAYHVSRTTVNHGESVLKEDEELTMKGVLEMNVASKDCQDSFKKPLRSSSLINGSHGEGIGQQNDMVGLIRTLLEEFRRIRAFYEEGLRQTTEIHLHICQVLEQFDSSKLK